jgi:prepilin peptidase CpaA
MLDTIAQTALWSLPFVTPIAIWVAWSDMATMKIPNKAVLALMIVFLIVGFFTMPLVDYGWRWLHFVVVLAIGFVMTITRLMGAGDAKFAAAMAPFVSTFDITLMIMIFAVCLVIAFATHRLARISPIRKMVPHWESWERTREFPMGYPLAAALVVYLVFAVTRV